MDTITPPSSIGSGTSMHKPLLIGEAPSKNEPLPRPLEGRSGERLARFAGLAWDDYLEKFERTNLLSVRQDTKEKGFEFDHDAAVVRAREIVNAIEPDRVVVLFGKRVAAAFGCVKAYFEVHRLPNGGRMYVVPHPSGVNRWWNDSNNCRRMWQFMHDLAEGKL